MIAMTLEVSDNNIITILEGLIKGYEFNENKDELLKCYNESFDKYWDDVINFIEEIKSLKEINNRTFSMAVSQLMNPTMYSLKKMLNCSKTEIHYIKANLSYWASNLTVLNEFNDKLMKSKESIIKNFKNLTEHLEKKEFDAFGRTIGTMIKSIFIKQNS